jgi:hypothetical protein
MQLIGDGWKKSDIFLALALSLAAFAVFWISPVRQVTDSTYAMVVSQGLINHQSIQLDRFNFTIHPPHLYEYYVANGDEYQLEQRNGHLYYFFPSGGAVLSVPFVGVMNVFGISAVFPDGTYNRDGEVLIQGLLSALLMGLLTGVLFLTSRLLLPVKWSLLAALGTAFGSQIWSTTSRGMWSDTWGVLLLGFALFLVLGEETRKLRLHPILLATLLAWAYFCRPTYSIAVIGLGIYMFFAHRRKFSLFALTGFAWAVAFIIYAWVNFRKPLPSYYLMHLRFTVFWQSLTGNLFSPGRGLFVYVPVLLFVAYLLVRFWIYVAYKRLAYVALFAIGAHLFVVGAFVHWWGGDCYGPRLTASLTPWFFLLAVLAIRAMLDWRETNSRRLTLANWKIPLAAGSLLLAFSVFANGSGAFTQDVVRWNEWVRAAAPNEGTRIWDWRYPQFLAGFKPPPPAKEFPLLLVPSIIDFTRPESDPFLWYGWSGAEQNFRWTSENEASLVFSVNAAGPLQMTISAAPFLAGIDLTRQRVTILLNDTQVADFEMTGSQVEARSIMLPAGILKRENILRFKLPDATAPSSVSQNMDTRLLGVAVHSIEFEPGKN